MPLVAPLKPTAGEVPMADPISTIEVCVSIAVSESGREKCHIADSKRARYAIAGDCHEFGGAKLMSGVVIECKVEVLK